MEQPDNLHMCVHPVADLATAIDRWLAAHGDYKKRASDESEYNYNAAYFALGEAWARSCPEAAVELGAFERFRRGLIAPGEEEPSPPPWKRAHVR